MKSYHLQAFGDPQDPLQVLLNTEASWASHQGTTRDF